MLLFDLLKLNQREFYRYIDDGWISEREHPDDSDLRIYNYTPKTQYEKYWTAATMNCRGLIVHWPSGEVVARPFRKFFNYGEYDLPEDVIFNEPVIVTDKLDGSLGIGYLMEDGVFCIATRGSFTSDQALEANELLWSEYEDRWEPNSEITYLFEIIYPENKIVVDYGPVSDLFLLGGIEIETGAFYAPEELPEWPGPRTETFPYETFREALEAPPRPGKEGLVVQWPTLDNYMLKLKQEDYIQIHRIVTNMSPRKLWELAAYNDLKVYHEYMTHNELCKALRLNPGEEYPPPDDIISALPDGLRQEFDESISILYQQINRLLFSVRNFVAKNKNLTRKEFALKAQEELGKDANIAFLTLDHKSETSAAWLNVRP